MRTIGDLAAFVIGQNTGRFLLTLDRVGPDARTCRVEPLRILILET